MNKFRVDEVHRTGVEVTPTTAFIPLTEVRSGEFVPVTVDWQWLTAMMQGGPTEGWGKVVLAPQFNVGGQPAEVIATCQRYAALLSDLLSRWT